MDTIVKEHVAQKKGGHNTIDTWNYVLDKWGLNVYLYRSRKSHW